MIRSVWRITRNAQDAEDAMQNALVAICNRGHRISEHSNPQALILMNVASIQCATWLGDVYSPLSTLFVGRWPF